MKKKKICKRNQPKNRNNNINNILQIKFILSFQEKNRILKQIGSNCIEFIPKFTFKNEDEKNIALNR